MNKKEKPKKMNIKKVIFSIGVTTKLNNKVREDIRNSITGNTELKKEIQRVLQQANRRAQNIEKSGLISPAYRSLQLEGRTGYSKFSITGLDFSNKIQWQKAKYEYAKAIEYLNNPTSTATGARQYIKHLSQKYNKPIDVVNNILSQSTSIEFMDNKIPLLNYRSMIDNYMKESKDDLNSMNMNAEQHAKLLEDNVNQLVNEVVTEIEETNQAFTESFKKVFKYK